MPDAHLIEMPLVLSALPPEAASASVLSTGESKLSVMSISTAKTDDTLCQSLCSIKCLKAYF